MVYKAIYYDHASKSIKKLLDFISETLDTRGTDVLKLPKVNTTTYGLKLWRYLAPKLWNLLPESDRTIKTFTGFKISIKKIDLSGHLNKGTYFYFQHTTTKTFEVFAVVC